MIKGEYFECDRIDIHLKDFEMNFLFNITLILLGQALYNKLLKKRNGSSCPHRFDMTGDWNRVPILNSYNAGLRSLDWHCV